MSHHKNNLTHSIKITAIASATAITLGSALTPKTSCADIYTLSFGPAVTNPIETTGEFPSIPTDPAANDGLFTMLDPGGRELQNVSYPYYGDPTWGYGFRTQIAGTFMLDTADNSGSVTIQPFQFFAAGAATFSDMTFTDAGVNSSNGHQLLLSNMSFSWNGNNGIPISLVWDIDGLMTAINGGLTIGDKVTSGALPASNNIRKGLYPIGPSPVATTTMDTNALCTAPPYNSCMGVNPIATAIMAGLPGQPADDGVGGSPMVDGPFVGFNINFDIKQLTVTNISPGIGSVNIDIAGGKIQECAAIGGSDITMNAEIKLLDNDTVDTITWSLDGVPVASDESAVVAVPLGVHTVEISVITILGHVLSDTESITVEDTVAPVINAAFLDSKGGTEITAINSKDKASLSINVNDVCDASPNSNATAGLPVFDGDKVSARTSKKDSSTELSIKSNADNIEVMTIAEDVSGNMSVKKITLIVNQ
ncbi:hypothetical protein N9985_02500 [Gammaproteobacteria bacterium]|nr:hypothetical protein [Gammaproteobacteria bacterium]